MPLPDYRCVPWVRCMLCDTSVCAALARTLRFDVRRPWQGFRFELSPAPFLANTRAASARAASARAAHTRARETTTRAATAVVCFRRTDRAGSSGVLRKGALAASETPCPPSRTLASLASVAYCAARGTVSGRPAPFCSDRSDLPPPTPPLYCLPPPWAAAGRPEAFRSAPCSLTALCAGHVPPCVPFSVTGAPASTSLHLLPRVLRME